MRGICLNIILLCLLFLSNCVQESSKKLFSNRKDSSENTFFTFHFVFMASAMVFFLIAGGGLHFRTRTVLYGLLFALSFAITIYTATKALKFGPMSVTCLAVSYALLIPTVAGIFLFEEPFTFTVGAGVLLMILSVYLICKSKDQERISVKWAVLTLLAVLGNGTCALLQKAYQYGNHGSTDMDFMPIAMLFATLLMLPFLLAAPKKSLRAVKSVWPCGVPAGLTNAFTNFVSLTLVSRMPATILYPVLSILCVFSALLPSVTLFHERLSAKQLVGIVIGILALLALNL